MAISRRRLPKGKPGERPNQYDEDARERMMPLYLASTPNVPSVQGCEAPQGSNYEGELSNVLVHLEHTHNGRIRSLVVSCEDDAVGRISRLAAAIAAQNDPLPIAEGLLPEGVPDVMRSIGVARRILPAIRESGSTSAFDDWRAATPVTWARAREEFDRMHQRRVELTKQLDSAEPMSEERQSLQADIFGAQIEYNSSVESLLFAAALQRGHNLAVTHPAYAATHMAAHTFLTPGRAFGARSQELALANAIDRLLWTGPCEGPVPLGSKIPIKVVPQEVRDATCMHVERLPMHNAPRYARARKRHSVSSGFKLHMPRIVNAAISGSTSRLFKRRIKMKMRGGSVLVDHSGSMSLSAEDIIKMIDAAPAAHIAYYAGISDEAGLDEHMGTLYIAAEHGKRIATTRRNLPKCGNGNSVDLWALMWLLEQPAPRIFVTDEGFTGPCSVMAHHLLELARLKKLVTVVPTIGQAAPLLGKPRVEEAAAR